MRQHNFSRPLKLAVVIPSLGVTLLSLLLMGQACGIATPVPAPFDPLKVNDDIRNACADWGNPPDSVLESFLIGMDMDRRSGVSEYDAMASVIANCNTMGSSAPFCAACSVKVVQQIYSQ